ncbi:EAL domain-containing protein [Lichenibacterium minor]|uniref:EAL domain-containing protein n=1 Tax=Lichenibacterium minor TaxID=2316528 RepID=A0A4Q2TZW4_9HYPH|nr:EAL domain-containing protein [Lichenibacterium minor]RYC29330.1 EAL domain-containing protein [Lichenibacterium minor]
MLKVLGCVVHDHDLRLVALSAVICVLGCLTTTTLFARATKGARRSHDLCLASAAVVFGCSIWSLHFVAMLAFMPGQKMAYDVGLTGLSIVVAIGGSSLALFAWKTPAVRSGRVALAGILLGLAISGMHYVGVAAMTFSGFLVFDHAYVVASVAISILFSVIALARASELSTVSRRIEVGSWLALAICGLHFTGMTAITIAPGTAEAADGVVLGTTRLAVVVGGVSLAILVASLVAVMVEHQQSRRSLRDMGRMRLMSNLAQEVLFIHRDGVVLEVNSAGERLFKAPADDIIGRPVMSLFAKDSAPALIRRERCPPMDRRPEEMDFLSVDGTHVTVELSCQPIDYLGKPATVVALRDLTDRKRDEARIRHLARHDALTNLPNRFNLQERLDIALDTAAQTGAAIALVYIDLDRFKPVNDLYGHAAGDALLVQASKRILGEIHAVDSLARIGGDEFVMILTSQPQPEKASVVATRVIEALRRPFQVEGHRVEIGASVGIALYPQDGADADALMRSADAAMYRVKQEGRGALRFFEASMNAQLQARLLLGQELAHAVERGELVLHYQPIVNGVTGEVETFEALIRWMHPTRGMVPPIQFIPLAEETGLIDGIGRWVIDTACREAAGWPHPWRVSVNVSPKQFRQTDVCAAIGDALEANGIEPARVVVEVTEGILIDDADKAVAILNRLREMGVRIALDDFGTGYSSLSYLQLFQFDKFKIDKSFVNRLGEDDRALTLTRTIVNLGHNLGLQVTAEGVETQAQLDVLRSLGCDQIQGYLVARPAPIDAFTDLDRLRTKALFGRERARLTA